MEGPQQSPHTRAAPEHPHLVQVACLALPAPPPLSLDEDEELVADPEQVWVQRRQGSRWPYCARVVECWAGCGGPFLPSSTGSCSKLLCKEQALALHPMARPSGAESGGVPPPPTWSRRIWGFSGSNVLTGLLASLSPKLGQMLTEAPEAPRPAEAVTKVFWKQQRQCSRQ